MIVTTPKRLQVKVPVRLAGFSLIEVLVALIILAIGVMSIAVMQLATYKQLQTSHNLSNAATLAAEIADRMLANDPNALPRYIHDAAPEDPPECIGVGAICDINDMADYDVTQWQAKVTAGASMPGSLPSGAGEINTVGGDYQITVRWDDDLSGSTGSDCDFSDPNDLDCYRLTVGF